MKSRAAWILLAIVGGCSDPAPTPKSVRRVVPEIVRIEGGAFRGQRLECALRPGETAGLNDTQLNVETFAIDKMVISCDAYAECADAGRCKPLLSTTASFMERGCDEGLAVVYRSEAARYCEFVGGRLPTSLEWQRAIRGRDGWRYPGGEAETAPDYLRTCARRTSRDPLFPRCLYASPDGVMHVRAGQAHYEHLGDQGCPQEASADPGIEPRAYAGIASEWMKSFAVGQSSFVGYFRCVYPAR